MEMLNQQPEEMAALAKVEEELKLLASLPVELDLWRPQNTYFSIEKRVCGSVKERAEKGDGLAKQWIEVFHRRQKGPELLERNTFPALHRQGDDPVSVVGSTSGQENRVTYLMYLSAFGLAKNSIHLTNSYFVPDRETVKALTEASRRGVDVKIVLPAKSDQGPVFYAGRSYYAHLLKFGVKLYERRTSMLHAKTAVVDNVWSTVGSTNMDLWSFLRNDEVNAIILGRDFANKLEALFQNDLENSDPITLEQWKKRPFPERAKEWFWRLWAHWL